MLNKQKNMNQEHFEATLQYLSSLTLHVIITETSCF